jgi:hypothetical protein
VKSEGPVDQEKSAQPPEPVEWDMVACGSDPETGRRRCTYSWSDGTRETFVEGLHPIHRKGLGRLVPPDVREELGRRIQEALGPAPETA